MAYQVSDDGITINVSDEIFAFPDKTVPTPDDDGVIMYFELLDRKGDKKNILWREKLGEGLKANIKDVTIPKAILTDFPQGYKLYAHRKTYPKKKERTDIYLFGRHRFRSPNEFLPHLIWIISDRSGQCNCKYCFKSTTDVLQKEPVLSALRTKRRRDVNTLDEIQSKRIITRSSDAKKITDNKKRATNNRRKVTDSRKKATRKTLTKKRKSKVVKLDDYIPPPVPKYVVFREGEIVLLAVSKVLNDETLAECNKIFSTDSQPEYDSQPDHESQLEYWPAIVGSITPQDDNESYESVIYTVKPLFLHENKNVTIDSLRPWLAHRLENPLSGSRFTRSLLNIDLGKATPEQIVEVYFKAIQKASEIVNVLTPMYQYDYHKSKGTKEKHDAIHFKAIYLGAELIYEDDIVRLLPYYGEDQSSPVVDVQPKEISYLQVTSIYEKKGFKVTGDLYERGKLLEKDEYEWIPKNKKDEEYTIDVSDVAGRFYPMYSDITESITCEFLKTFENRALLLGEDVPPIINLLMDSEAPNIVTPREPDTLTTKKQTDKRSSSLPPISTISTERTERTEGKRPIPFSHPQNEPSKRVTRESLEVDIKDIKEKTETNIEIKIGDEKEITIKRTSETKSKIVSPLKFSDIERRYAKKSDDIDLPPLVVSPDTPTFETDDDISDVDVWNKLNANNGGDSK